MFRFTQQLSSSRSGNALVLAVLILLALTSVGVVSVQRTNTDLLVAGNVVRVAQAHLAGEAGAVHCAQLIGSSPSTFKQMLRQQRELNPNMAQWLRLDGYSTADPDPTSSAVDRTEHISVVFPPAPDDVPARMRQDTAYEMVAQYLGEVQGVVPGYQVGELCHVLFDLNAEGGIPTALQPVRTTLNPLVTDSVVVTSRARAQIGIVRCGIR